MKKLAIDEVSLFDTAETTSIELEHRNVSMARLTIYKVDLMQLYLKHKNLSEITSINLSGIEPDFSLEKKLIQKVATSDEKTKVILPIKEDGAYLVICQGDYKYTSGLVLKSPLKIEIQELELSGKIRVNVKERKSGKLLNGVHIKAIGSSDLSFQIGDTDLRGVWESNTITGKVTAIARDQKGRYAFYRGKEPLLVDNSVNIEEQQRGSVIDFNSNTFQNQLLLNEGNLNEKKKFLQKRGESIKLKAIRKSKK